MFVGEQFAGAAHAALHFVQRQEQAEFVAGGAEISQEKLGATRTPPSPWIGSTRIPAVCAPMALRTAFMLPNGT